MKIEPRHIAGIGVGVFIIFIDLLRFRNEALFVPLLIAGFTISWLQFWIDFFVRKRRERQYEGEFLEFVRNLVSAVKSGMPVSRAVLHVADADYGGLTPYVKKLSHQIEWSIPFHRAFVNFANETRNPVVKRAVATVIEAEQAGGNLEDVLTAITESLVEIKKIAQQRRASIHGQVVQSYIIFLVFLGVMVVIQNLLIPYISGMDQGATGGLEADSGSFLQAQMVQVDKSANIDYSSAAAFISTMSDWFVSLNGVFVMLTMIQGLFAGMIIGKLSEGDISAGLKHSLILMTVGFTIISFAQGL